MREIVDKEQKTKICKTEGREGGGRNYTLLQSSDLSLNLGWEMHIVKTEISP